MRNQAEQSSPKRSDRDRFVAFAFAAADVLIELDIDFRVSYATGATQALHRSKTNTLIGAPLVDLVATEDRDRLRATLEAIPKGGRMAPIRVRLAGQGSRLVVVSGYQLPDFESHLYLAISFDTAVPSEARTTLARRDGETGLFEKEGFGALVGERLETAKARGDDVELTLLDLEKISDLRERVAAEEIDAFIAGVSETLRANSVEATRPGVSTATPSAWFMKRRSISTPSRPGSARIHGASTPPAPVSRSRRPRSTWTPATPRPRTRPRRSSIPSPSFPSAKATTSLSPACRRAAI